MLEYSDNELRNLLKRNSLEAYEVLFKKYYKLLCLQAALLLGDESEAEDLVQELFVEIWDKQIYCNIEQSPKAYFYRAVRNRCLNKIKRTKASKEKLDRYHEYRLNKKEPTWLEQKELATNMKNVLQKLPPQRLRAFTLVYMEDMRYQDAADEMGISINSVKTHLKLALEVLRDRLEAFR